MSLLRELWKYSGFWSHKHHAPNGADLLGFNFFEHLPHVNDPFGGMLDTVASAHLDSLSFKHVAQVVNLRLSFITTTTK
jgi:hypothetical protein